MRIRTRARRAVNAHGNAEGSGDRQGAPQALHFSFRPDHLEVAIADLRRARLSDRGQFGPRRQPEGTAGLQTAGPSPHSGDQRTLRRSRSDPGSAPSRTRRFAGLPASCSPSSSAHRLQPRLADLRSGYALDGGANALDSSIATVVGEFGDPPSHSDRSAQRHAHPSIRIKHHRPTATMSGCPTRVIQRRCRRP